MDITSFYAIKYTSNDASLIGFVVDPDRQPAMLVKTFLTSEEADLFINRCQADLPGFTYEVLPFAVGDDRLTVGTGTLVSERDEARELRDYWQGESERRQERITQLGRELSEEQRQHRFDISHISERLIEEATSRGWCSDYDGIVDDLNESLFVELGIRPKLYDVTTTYTVTVTAQVMATDEDDALAKFSPSRHDVRDAIDNGSFEENDDDREASRA